MNRLRELRKNRNWTLIQATEELKKHGLSISPDALAKYERGDREPKLDSWQKLADTFGVTVSYTQGISDFQTGYPEMPLELGETVLETFNKRYANSINENASDEEKRIIAEGTDGYNDLLSVLTYAPTNSNEENRKKRELLEKFHSIPTAINVYLSKPSEASDDSLYPKHDAEKLNKTLDMLNDAVNHFISNLNVINDVLYK
ncbi:helix-turn-helix domain-containing protein [Levilactobacillus brevis]|uniref:helix-turn-helix domain-containing protein n=1 Tax=Levilactobacillus brevis TaxID=1580 RepID=UPI001BDDD35D|nr:helix-turn-helix transcriptional regulator [Levilactobacillus brevis]